MLTVANKAVRVPEPSADGCSAIAEIVSRLGEKWTVLVLANLASGQPARYSDLRRGIEGISQRMLTLTLKGLEQDGLVSRTVYPTIPPRVDYQLTGLGHELVAPLQALYEWALEHRPLILEARSRFESEAQFRARTAEVSSLHRHRVTSGKRAASSY
jgi:DNA-binding HxlR family transcriptional regulator